MNHSKNYPFIVAAAFAVGLMLSPETLTLLGNCAGYAGWSLWWIMILVLLFHLVNTFGYTRLFACCPGPAGEAALVNEALGRLPAIWFPLASRVVLFACIATGLLATAGFVFNEVFVYWFPNFAFAALILALLFIINLCGKKFSAGAQILFTALALVCLIILCVYGFVDSGQKLEEPAGSVPVAQIPSAVILGLLLFVGYDLAAFFKQDDQSGPSGLCTAMMAGLGVVFGVFFLWDMLSVSYVELDRLVDSTIPHTRAAKAILGQPGRVLIGLAAISGACAAVNALLCCVAEMVTGMSQVKLLPAFLRSRPARIPVTLTLLALCPAVMMFLGLAGAPELDVCVRAGLWFWLLNYAVVHISLLIMKKHPPAKEETGRLHHYPLVSAFSLCMLAIALGAVLVYYEEPLELFRFLVIIGGGSLGVSLVFCYVGYNNS